MTGCAITLSYPRRNLIDLSDFSAEEVNALLALAADIKKNPAAYQDACRGRVMATLFYEPSTRTQLSFQTAMLRLGGSVIGFDNPGNSSVSKGECLTDTTTIVSGYSDVLVIRHPKEGAARAASLKSKCSVVNAGDGGHLHPTQTLTDLLTLSQEKGRLTGLTIGLCGDLKNGRTVHSLIRAMSAYPGNRFILISTPYLALPDYSKAVLEASGCAYEEVSSLEEAIPQLDVLYMTRIQKERFESEEAYRQEKDVYILTKEKLEKGKQDLLVLHPLPRVDEISYEVDDDPRAMYFDQAVYGMYVRMALVYTLLLGTPAPLTDTFIKAPAHTCSNPNCITRSEPNLPHYYVMETGSEQCAYCSHAPLR